MKMDMVASGNEALEARALTEAELEEVNGGLFFLLALGGFGAGFAGGWVAANYAVTGNFWGDID
jgi:lactobin A/cerein 7B family class IIb bacteriocin